MTSAEDTTETQEHTSVDGVVAAPGSGGVVRLHTLVASISFVAAVVLYLGAAALRVWPDLFEGVAFLSYGRLLPMATNLLLFGWLTVGLAGVMYHVLPRVVGAALAVPRLAVLNLALMVAAVGVGVVAVGLGENAGGHYLELPWYSDIALVASFFVMAVIAMATAARGDRTALPLSGWYLVAAPWWLTFSYAAGMVPGLDGVGGALQASFVFTATVGLWLAAVGIGAGYHLVGRLVPGVEFHPRMGRIGFWSLGFIWVWTAGRSLQYGPSPDWMETLPVVFSAGAIVAVVTILTDFAYALRGKWASVSGQLPLRLYALGWVLFAVVPLQMFVMSLRGASATVHLTAWETAFEQLTLLGAFTLWTMGLVAHALSTEVGRKYGRVFGSTSVWFVAAGAVIAMGSRWVAGLQQGYTWIGSVNSGAVENTGDGFRNSVTPLEAVDVVQVAGLGLLAVGAVLFGLSSIRVLVGRASAPGSEAVSASMSAAPLSKVLQGAWVLFFASFVAVFLVPIVDADEEPTILAVATRDFDAGSQHDIGRELYVSEGCWYCHTQQVRVVVTDVGLGPVSVAGDYAVDGVDLLGVERVGPDLMHAGTRAPTDSIRWVKAHLVDPRGSTEPGVARPWSTMPAYDYLDDTELTALAVYVAGLGG